MLAVTWLVPLLVTAKDDISPVPLAARPMDVLSLVHVNEVAPAPLKLTALLIPLLQITWSVTVFTAGVGFTVIVNVIGVPEQLFADGVIVIVPDIGDVPVFFAVKEEILPDPLGPSPIAVLLFVQLYVVLPTEPLKLTAAVLVLLHNV
jgi:hypothetical protein